MLRILTLTFIMPGQLQKNYAFFSHLDSATSHTAKNSMHYLQVLLVTQFRRRRLSPNCLPDLNLCFLYLWGILRHEFAVTMLTVKKLCKKAFRSIFNQTTKTLTCNDNTFVRCDARLSAKENHSSTFFK